MSPILYELVAARAEHRCEYCQAPEAIFNHRFPIDHVVPRVFGGTDDPDNLALACHSCNGYKHQKLTALDQRHGLPARLFNPRHDKWEEHFRWNRTRTLLFGRTSIGRATVSALQLNSERQIHARILWQKLNEIRDKKI